MYVSLSSFPWGEITADPVQAEDKGWQAAFDKFSNQMRAWNLQVRLVAAPLGASAHHRPLD